MVAKRYKCPKHNQWMKTNKYRRHLGPICEMCLLEKEANKREAEKTGGSYHQEIKIIKL